MNDHVLRQPSDQPGQGHGHGHGHGRAEDHLLDWDARADELEREGEIALPCTTEAIAWVAGLCDVADVRTVLDIGSGPGVATSVLAAGFPAATVTAVDAAPRLLARARQRAQRFGVEHRVGTLELSLDGDLAELPLADVIWASRVLHHLPDQPKALHALGSRLRPGGLLVLVEGGLPSRFLPEESGLGAPGLLARIDAAVSSGVAESLRHGDDSPVPRPVLDWPAQLAAAGFTASGSKSFLLDLPAPVSPAVREHLGRRLARTTGRAGQHRLTDADRESLDQLLDRRNPLGIWQRQDLFLLTADTVHTGRRP